MSTTRQHTTLLYKIRMNFINFILTVNIILVGYFFNDTLYFSILSWGLYVFCLALCFTLGHAMNTVVPAQIIIREPTYIRHFPFRLSENRKPRMWSMQVLRYETDGISSTVLEYHGLYPWWSILVVSVVSMATLFLQPQICCLSPADTTSTMPTSLRYC